MAEKKLVRSKSGLRIISTDDSGNPFALEEPQWVPDKECQTCCACSCKYDFMRRRHHCRRCGLCYCGKCCSQLISLHRMSFVDPVRHCEACAPYSRTEAEFFDKHVKVLMSGASFMRRSDTKSGLCVMYLSSDQKHLRLDGEGQVTTVPLRRIVAGNIRTDSTDAQGNVGISGLCIKYRSGEEEDNVESLDVNVAGAQAVPWIKAMQKALKILLQNNPAALPTGKCM